MQAICPIVVGPNPSGYCNTIIMVPKVIDNITLGKVWYNVDIRYLLKSQLCYHMCFSFSC